MLILGIKPGESFFIGEDIKVTNLDRNKIGIDAPKEKLILREKFMEQQAGDDYAIRNR